MGLLNSEKGAWVAQLLTPSALEPALHDPRTRRHEKSEKPAHRAWREAPAPQLESALVRQQGTYAPQQRPRAGKLVLLT